MYNQKINARDIFVRRMQPLKIPKIISTVITVMYFIVTHERITGVIRMRRDILIKNKFRHLDLFSGIGGFSLGLEATGGFETVAFCDIEEYPRKVLQKHWPYVKQYEDIKELNYEKLKADGLLPIHIVTGGYPCQPFSYAGLRTGEQDPRHLWPEMFRIIKELRPTWVVGENVPGHIKLGLDTVLQNLADQGYSARTFSVSASSVGANHKRERIWIVAHSERDDNFNKEQRVDGEEKEVPRERGENDSAPGESSRTSAVRQTNNGDVANTENIGSVLSPYEKEREGNSPRRSERKSEGSSTVANTESFGSDGGEIREPKEKGGQERILGSKVGGVSSDVADTKQSRPPSQQYGDDRELEKKVREKKEEGNQSSIRTSTRSSDVADSLKGHAQAGRERRREIREMGQGEGISNNVAGSREAVADTKSDEEDGVLRTAGSESDQGNPRMESSGSRDGQPKREASPNMADANVEGLERQRESRGQFGSESTATESGEERQGEVDQGWWSFEPDVGRVAHGVPKRVDRLKCLGNSLIPHIPYYLGQSILKTYIKDEDEKTD